MLKDKIRWNRKYESEEVPKNPSEIVKNFYKYAKRGRALDIACGNGRNSKFLAKKSFIVDAVDISDVALKNIENYENINPIEADLDNYTLEKNSYELIICINYLNRDLFAQIKDALKIDAILIYETLVYDKELEMKMKREYLLEKNELLHYFIDFEIIYYEEKVLKNMKNEIIRKAYLVCRNSRCR